MKIILSRKGFDSKQGRKASPILPDGSTLSLPIPAPEKYPDTPTRYRDVRWRDSSLAPIVECLTGGRVRGEDVCHLDPDIRIDALDRLPEWRPAFGQVDGAQTELENQGVNCGDLFLFFGWFRRVEESPGGRWRYVPRAPDVHQVFGWLQVSEIVCVGADTAGAVKHRSWLHAHPHVNGGSWPPSNTIYVATPRLRIDGTEIGGDGAGVFRCATDGRQCMLTRPGEPMSHWRLPWEMWSAWLHRRPKQYRKREGSWVHVDVRGQGQEFVFDGTPGVIEWVRKLFEQHRGI